MLSRENHTGTQPISTVENLQPNLDTLARAIANLATAQGEIRNTTNPIFALTTSPKVLPFTVSVPSTDNNVFTFDDTNNTITFLNDASYNFTSIVTFETSTSSSRTITFRLVNVATGATVIEQSNEFEVRSGDVASFPLNTLVTVGKNGIPVAPLTIRIEVLANATGVTFNAFDSILMSSSSYDTTILASGVEYDNAVSGLAATTAQAAIDELVIEKANTSHTHSIDDVTGLQLALDGKLSTTGKAADSDKLDGLDSTVFTRSGSSVALTGDVTGTATVAADGSISIGATVASSGVTAGTYTLVTVDVKGRVTAGSSPTTVAGYGITDIGIYSDFTSSFDLAIA